MWFSLEFPFRSKAPIPQIALFFSRSATLPFWPFLQQDLKLLIRLSSFKIRFQFKSTRKHTLSCVLVWKNAERNSVIICLGKSDEEAEICEERTLLHEKRSYENGSEQRQMTKIWPPHLSSGRLISAFFLYLFFFCKKIVKVNCGKIILTSLITELKTCHFFKFYFKECSLRKVKHLAAF